MSATRAKHVAIVGATGAVGQEMLDCLEERNFPIGELTLLASARSAGKGISFKGRLIKVKELTHDSFEGVDIALFSAGGGLSLEYAPSAAAAGAIVIDNSSAFRMDEDVPLVVPEINPEAVKDCPKGIIANPNCTTIISLMALYPLHKLFGLKSIIASSYQAVSGSGAQGITELDEQIKVLGAGGEVIERCEHATYPSIVSPVSRQGFDDVVGVGDHRLGVSRLGPPVDGVINIETVDLGIGIWGDLGERYHRAVRLYLRRAEVSGVAMIVLDLRTTEPQVS